MKNNKKDISAVRIDFNKLNIDFNSTPDNPMSFFQIWFDDILSLDKHQAITAILSTISINNKPKSRVVLIKEVNEDGFIFLIFCHRRYFKIDFSVTLFEREIKYHFTENVLFERILMRW